VSPGSSGGQAKRGPICRRASPSTRRASRNLWPGCGLAGAAMKMRDARLATASTRCSQVSRIRRIRLSRRYRSGRCCSSDCTESPSMEADGRSHQVGIAQPFRDRRRARAAREGLDQMMSNRDRNRGLAGRPPAPHDGDKSAPQSVAAERRENVIGAPDPFGAKGLGRLAMPESCRQAPPRMVCPDRSTSEIGSDETVTPPGAGC